MVKIFIHNPNQLIPPYKLFTFLLDNKLTVTELIQHVYQVYPQTQNLEFKCYHVFDQTQIKCTWNYETYVKENNRKLLNGNDIITDYEFLLLISHHSQHNEDFIINKIFDTIGFTNKFFVDIGGKDGCEISNVYNLRMNGWKGLCCDADTVPKVVDGTTIIRQFILPENLESTLKKYDVPNIFDFLSIDIDGDDYYIWQSFKNYKPRVICIELDGSSYKKDYVAPYGTSRGRSSCSIIKMTKSCKEMGYKLIYNNGGNGFYVMEEYFHLFKPLSNDSLKKYIDDMLKEFSGDKNNKYNCDKGLLDKLNKIFQSYKEKLPLWNCPYIPTVNLLE